MDITQIIQTAIDVQHFVEVHPIISGAVASVIATSESLPFVKKLQASGVVQLAMNIIKTIYSYSKKGA